MKHRQIILWTVILVASFFGVKKSHAQAPGVQPELVKPLMDTYEYWQKATALQNYNGWKAITASHRIIAIQNRIFSEKGTFPADVFNTPAPAPTLAGLKVLRARSNGQTAKLVCFGKVNFGVGGDPSENILVISYLHEGGRWKYDFAEFVNLSGLTDIRKKLKAGDTAYLDGEAFMPDGKLPRQPIKVGPAKYIAKVYTYCPGREIRVSVNDISKHRFQDTQQSEVVIGGARDGANNVWYSIKNLPGYTGNEPVTVRVYLFSQIPGVKPINVFQYETKEGQKPNATGTGTFRVAPEHAAKILGH